MQAYKLPAINGFFWAWKGWSCFFQYPLNMLSWSFSLSFLILLALNIPLIGLLFNIALMPTFMLVSFSLGRKMAEGKLTTPDEWMQSLGIISLSILKRVLFLGIIYSFICIVAMLLSFLPFINELTDISKQLSSKTDVDLSLVLIRFYKPVCILALISIVINAFFWYAPVLVAWHGLGILQSLFFSAIACWRNKLTFSIYGLFWILLFLSIDGFANFLGTIGIPQKIVNIIEITLTLISNSALWSSFYPSYAGIFHRDPHFLIK